MASHPTIDTKREKHLPGEEGVWVFILGDLAVFAVFFLTFVYYRGANAALFTSQQELLSRGLGLLNTVLLLTSSLFVAQAVRAARSGRREVSLLIGAAIACGLGFVLVKVIEWGAKIGAGITLNTNEFFIFYYMFTGIHLAHVLIGLGVLCWMLLNYRAAQREGRSSLKSLEGGASFWHLVDLLWVVLFPLLYLMK